jgi:hypothetical protein
MTRRLYGATFCAGPFIDDFWEMSSVIILRSSTQTFTVVRIGESKWLTGRKADSTRETSFRLLEKLWNTVFWDVTPCTLVEVCRRFGEICCLYIYGQGVNWRSKANGNSTFLRNVSKPLPDYTASQSTIPSDRCENLKNRKSAKCTLSIQLQWGITCIITGNGVFVNSLEYS